MARRDALFADDEADENIVTNDAPAIQSADDFKPTDALFQDLRHKVIEARDHFQPWYTEARMCYDMYANRQWTEEDRQILEAQLRPVITFNRVAPVVDSLVGMELNDRKQVNYYPRTLGDAAINEIYTAAAQYVRDESNAEDEESDAFMDLSICGMGWTDTHLVNDRSEDGSFDIQIDRVDPLEMSADPNSKKRNRADDRYRVRTRDIPLLEAEGMFPGFEPDELNAGWASDSNNQELIDTPQKYLFTDQASSPDVRSKHKVTIVEIQWWEKRDFYQVLDPTTGEISHFDAAQYKLLEERYPKVQQQFMAVTGQMLPNIKAAKYKRKVFRRAFLGNKQILKISPLPYPYGFSLNCMTGKRDRNKRHWFGLVRAMKDPQEWANKWLSQVLHVINSNAKGGLMAVKDAFDDFREVEANWARPDFIAWVKDANSLNMIKQREQVQFPQGLYQLMDFAISSIRDVNGFNLELLGIADRNQPASLEYQRRQSGMTVLAQFFNALRQYRKAQGKGMLYMIQKWLGDGRLIRITTDEGNEAYIPLLRQANEQTVQYDVVVDEIAASPNQKEQVWQMLIQAMPFLQNMNLPGSAWVDIIKYSPLPAALSQKIAEAINVPPDQAQQAFAAKMQQLTMALAEANVRVTNSEAQENEADIGAKAAKAQKDIADAQKTASDTAMQNQQMAAASRASAIAEAIKALGINQPSVATQSPFVGQLSPV